MQIDDWFVTAINTDPYTAPELVTKLLGGVISGHPRLPDGTRTTVSKLRGRCGEDVISHSGGRYRLGTPAADYIKMYPDCKARLLASLSELSEAAVAELSESHKRRHEEFERTGY